VPATEVEPNNSHEALYGVLDFGHWEKRVWMCHEAISNRQHSDPLGSFGSKVTHFVILSSIDRGSRMKVGRVTRLRSAPGRSCEIICMSTFGEFQVSYIPQYRFPSPRYANWFVQTRTAALLRVYDCLVLPCDFIASGLVGG
jgi:hypothetical protein